MDLITLLSQSKFLPTSVDQVGRNVKKLPDSKWRDFVNQIEKPSILDQRFYFCVQQGLSLEWYGEVAKLRSKITAFDFTREKFVVWEPATFESFEPVDCFYSKSGILHGGELFIQHVKDIDFYANFCEFFVKESDLKMDVGEIAWFESIAGHRVRDSIRLASGRDINQVFKFPVRQSGIYRLMEVNALTLSIMVDHLGFLQWLTTNGADMDAAVGSDKLRPLHYCVLFRDTQIMRLLLAQCKNLDQADRNGFTPLYLCFTSYGYRKFLMAKMLLAAGADPNVGTEGPDGHSRYPVLNPITTDDLDLLRQYGANWNVRCKRTGQTPLHRNTDQHKGRVFIELVALGLDPNQPDYQGKTPLDLLRSQGGEEVFHEVCTAFIRKSFEQRHEEQIREFKDEIFVMALRGGRSAIVILPRSLGVRNALMVDATGKVTVKLEVPAAFEHGYGFVEAAYVNDELTAFFRAPTGGFAFVINEKTGKVIRTHDWDDEDP
jgi:hypothetical protein